MKSWTILCMILATLGLAVSQDRRHYGGNRNCRNVQCPRLQCPWGRRSYTPAGRCCPLCVSRGGGPGFPPRPSPDRPNCAAVSCVIPDNCPNNDFFTPQGQCCPVCRGPQPPPGPNCALVRCAGAPCSRPIPPRPGQCCATCPSGPDCSRVACPAVACRGSFTPPGECCPRCPSVQPPYCSLVSCALPQCPQHLWYQPRGECCQRCRRPTGGSRGNY